MSHHMDKISKLEIVTTKIHQEGEVSDPDVNKAKLGLVPLIICSNVRPQHFIQTVVVSFRAYDAILDLAQTNRP